MPRSVELDTFLVTLKVPRNLPPVAITRIRLRIDHPTFRSRLTRAVRGLLRQYPTLAEVTLSVSR